METLLKHADIAMYRAKAQARNNVQFYSSEMGCEACSAVALTAGLRQALAQGEFELHYQPRVDVPSGRMAAVEALLRWNHPQLGMLLPGQFIQSAEDSGLIVQIGEWALREACAQARRWTDAGGDQIAVAVNLSMRQLRSPDLVGQVRAALEGNGLPPGRLELEITESMAIQGPERTQLTLRELSGLGVRLALDDFGTGHSALHYLKRFPFDVLKIDRSFIEGLPGTATTRPSRARSWTSRTAWACRWSPKACGCPRSATFFWASAAGCARASCSARRRRRARSICGSARNGRPRKRGRPPFIFPVSLR